MKSPESRAEKADVKKGNATDQVTVHGDYIQIHGDQINKKNESDPPMKTSRKKTIILELEGSLEDIYSDDNSVEKFKEVIKILRQISSDGSVMMRDIQTGSIKITVDGSEDGINRILSLIKQDERQEIAGFSILRARELNEVEKKSLKSKLLNYIYRYDENTFLNRFEVLRDPLSGAILNDDEESNIIRDPLTGADLRGVDLSEINLSKTNLSGADLSKANLTKVNFKGANLSKTNFSEANLSAVDFSEANLEGTIFRDNQGLSEKEKIELKRRGAIVKDSGDNNLSTEIIF